MLKRGMPELSWINISSKAEIKFFSIFFCFLETYILGYIIWLKNTKDENKKEIPNPKSKNSLT